MTDTPIVDTQVLREQVREKYRAVAVDPDATYHFHTGRPLAARLGYDPAIVDAAARPGRRVLRRGRQPVLAAHDRSPVNGSSTSAPAPGSTASSPPTTSGPRVPSSAST